MGAVLHIKDHCQLQDRNDGHATIMEILVSWALEVLRQVGGQAGSTELASLQGPLETCK